MFMEITRSFGVCKAITLTSLTYRIKCNKFAFKLQVNCLNILIIQTVIQKNNM